MKENSLKPQGRESWLCLCEAFISGYIHRVYLEPPMVDTRLSPAICILSFWSSPSITVIGWTPNLFSTFCFYKFYPHPNPDRIVFIIVSLFSSVKPWQTPPEQHFSIVLFPFTGWTITFNPHLHTHIQVAPPLVTKLWTNIGHVLLLVSGEQYRAIMGILFWITLCIQ